MAPIAFATGITSIPVTVNSSSPIFTIPTTAGISITSDSSSFTLQIDSSASPVATNNLFKFTIESSVPAAATYALGATGPGGGKVFYIAPSPFDCGPSLNLKCLYLEAAPTTGISAWTDSALNWTATTDPAFWSSSLVAIGTGLQNTNLVVAAKPALGYANANVRAYRGPNNLDDWFLPSEDELTQLYNQRSYVDGLNNNAYWSSTESGGNSAVLKNLSSGARSTARKNTSSGSARPVRAF